MNSMGHMKANHTKWTISMEKNYFVYSTKERIDGLKARAGMMKRRKGVMKIAT